MEAPLIIIGAPLVIGIAIGWVWGWRIGHHHGCEWQKKSYAHLSQYHEDNPRRPAEIKGLTTSDILNERL